VNKVTFFISADPKGNTRYISARIITPLGNEFHVGYHDGICADKQRDGLNFGPNGRWQDGEFIGAWEDPAQPPNEDNDGWIAAIWLEDKTADDTFCSEMFADLTGRYPYEVEAHIKPNQDYTEFPRNIE
jgi:hypothetical protein